jgi:hypothetical protein
MVWEFVVGVFFKGDIFISNCNTTRGEIIDQKWDQNYFQLSNVALPMHSKNDIIVSLDHMGFIMRFWLSWWP